MIQSEIPFLCGAFTTFPREQFQVPAAVVAFLGSSCCLTYPDPSLLVADQRRGSVRRRYQCRANVSVPYIIFFFVGWSGHLLISLYTNK